VSALLGRMPRRWATSRTLAEEMGVLAERHHLDQDRARSPRSRRCTWPADDLTDPSPATTFRASDATGGAVAPRCIASASTGGSIRSIPPAAQLDPLVVGEEHYNTARGVQA